MEKLVLDFDIPSMNQGDFEMMMRREIMNLSGVNFKMDQTAKSFGRVPYKITVTGTREIVVGWGDWFLNNFCAKYMCLDFEAKRQVEQQFKAFENALV